VGICVYIHLSLLSLRAASVITVAVGVHRATCPIPPPSPNTQHRAVPSPAKNKRTLWAKSHVQPLRRAEGLLVLLVLLVLLILLGPTKLKQPYFHPTKHTRTRTTPPPVQPTSPNGPHRTPASPIDLTATSSSHPRIPPRPQQERGHVHAKHGRRLPNQRRKWHIQIPSLRSRPCIPLARPWRPLHLSACLQFSE
jgi:hypothetical protein